MVDFILNKNNFNMNDINSKIDDYAKTNNISIDKISKMQVVIEEFLANILFPNFEDETLLSFSKYNNNIVISFSYTGKDFMNKITDESFLSLKLIESKTSSIKSNTKDNKTIVEFTI